MAVLPLRRNERLMTVLLLAVPLVLCLLLRLFFPLRMPGFSDTRGAFQLKDGAWTPGPRFSGGLRDLEVSSQGAVWAISESRGGLCRLEGDRWTYYGGRQFGTRTDWIQGGFALRDDEVWATGGEGVVRFDGDSWRWYADGPKSGLSGGTVAGRSGVWVMDPQGNLAHFDGTSWTTRNLGSVLPAAKPASEDADDSPRLAMADSGRLWVFWRGLWLQDGDSWRAVRPAGVNLSEVWPIGHDGENVWLRLWRTGEIAEVTPDGRVAARHGWREMGLPSPAGINSLAASNGRIRIATASGLLTFGGGQWRNFGRPPGCTTITDVALAPDGSVWVLGESRPLARIAAFFGPPLGAAAIALVAIGLLISAWLQGRAENMLAAEQALVAAAGPLPGIDVATGQADIDRQARAVRWILCTALAGFPFAAFAVKEAVGRVWPGAPGWTPYAGLLAIVALVCLSAWLRNPRRRQSGPGNAEQRPRSRVREAMWLPALWILSAAVLLLCGLTPLGWVNRLIPSANLASMLRFAQAVLLVTLINKGRDQAAVRLVLPAMRAGDYERAMRWIRRLSLGVPTALLRKMEGTTAGLAVTPAWRAGNYDLALDWIARLRRIRPSVKLLRMEGTTHGLANRPAEAEGCYRQALAGSRGSSGPDLAGLLGCLAESLEDQGRYEESRRCRQAAIDMGDNILGSSRHSQAELLLRQGTEPQRALELVDEAMRIAKGPVAAKVEPSRSATRAWALALLGRRQEAEQAIERALLLRGDAMAGSVASTRIKVGMALAAMDQPDKALEHFRAAYDADPKGKYGARALQQIERLGAQGR
jgi:tetratricopeptide (TPR) repeat protein